MPTLAKTEVRTDAAPPPRPFYSQGVVVGNMVYVSGSLGVDSKTGKLVGGTTADRTHLGGGGLFVGQPGKVPGVLPAAFTQA
ncbi:Endoribonuclease L-PSP [Fusarium albosuccineum]|uniref:Endoribonuclease L-PSP n=1 Tax=Fusarium albosuccineum TaxID=1237068 RepID=A0A8H4PE26_9HYPO|nr:Endoribonuclease L-PSP [Fusarium albosuccineum]